MVTVQAEVLRHGRLGSYKVDTFGQDSRDDICGVCGVGRPVDRQQAVFLCVSKCSTGVDAGNKGGCIAIRFPAIDLKRERQANIESKPLEKH